MLQKYAPHYSALTRLGIPIIVGQIGTVVLGFADTLMIGQHSTPELAAASFVNNLYALIFTFALGFSYGLTPLVGACYGRGESTRIGQLLRNSMGANGLLAVFLIVLMSVVYVCIPYMGQPAELIPLIRPYFLINLASIPFVVFFNVFKQLSDGVMQTRTGMWIMLGGNLLNILGNYMLIYGAWGMPELGLTGAGISTLMSRMAMMLTFLVIVSGVSFYHDFWHSFRQNRCHKTDMRLLAHMGLPMGLQIGMESAAFSLTAIIVGWIGINALAANQVILICSQFCYFISSGMAAAVAIRVSYFNGQHDYQALRHSVTAGFQLVLLCNLCTAATVGLLRWKLGEWFTDSNEVSQLVAISVIPLMVYQFSDGLQCTYANALRGLGRVKLLVPVAFLAYFVISLPLGYLLAIPLGWGLPGIWWAYPVALSIAGICFFLDYRRTMRSLGQQTRVTI